MGCKKVRLVKKVCGKTIGVERLMADVEILNNPVAMDYTRRGLINDLAQKEREIMAIGCSDAGSLQSIFTNATAGSSATLSSDTFQTLSDHNHYDLQYRHQQYAQSVLFSEDQVVKALGGEPSPKKVVFHRVNEKCSSLGSKDEPLDDLRIEMAEWLDGV